MNCKDCEHYLLCANDITNLYEDFKNKNDFEERCLYFKDKSTMLELPCKVGDTVYAINKHKIYKCRVCGINIDYKSSWFTFLYNGTFPKFKEIYYLSNFGKTVFLTKEEAEKALEGLK